MIEPPAASGHKEDLTAKRMDHDSDRRGRARPAACLCRSEREVIFHTQGRVMPVPPEVVEVLNNAKQTVFNGKDGTSKTVPTYPFQIEK